jgi:chromate transporter
VSVLPGVDLLLAFGRVGLFGWGGGPSAIPLVQAEVVERYRWMSDGEFLDTLAVANTLPGPIATKMAIHVGYRVDGLLGALLALVGLVTPSGLAVVGLAAALQPWKDHPRVVGLLDGVRPAVVGMLAWVAVDMARGVTAGPASVVIAVLTFSAMAVWKVHPAWLFVGAATFGALFLGRR